MEEKLKEIKERYQDDPSLLKVVSIGIIYYAPTEPLLVILNNHHDKVTCSVNVADTGLLSQISCALTALQNNSNTNVRVHLRAAGGGDFKISYIEVGDCNPS
jgi:hypothetical protein